MELGADWLKRLEQTHLCVSICVCVCVKACQELCRMACNGESLIRGGGGGGGGGRFARRYGVKRRVDLAK